MTDYKLDHQSFFVDGLFVSLFVKQHMRRLCNVRVKRMHCIRLSKGACLSKTSSIRLIDSIPTCDRQSDTDRTDTDRRTYRRRYLTGFCSPDLADIHDLYISSDEKPFNKILTCPNHILRTLLPPPTAQNYSLRNRPYNRQLRDRISRITDCNFTVRMLYRNMY